MIVLFNPFYKFDAWTVMVVNYTVFSNRIRA